jgi:hypothetical protein
MKFWESLSQLDLAIDPPLSGLLDCLDHGAGAFAKPPRVDNDDSTLDSV